MKKWRTYFKIGEITVKESTVNSTNTCQNVIKYPNKTHILFQAGDLYKYYITFRVSATLI